MDTITPHPHRRSRRQTPRHEEETPLRNNLRRWRSGTGDTTSPDEPTAIDGDTGASRFSALDSGFESSSGTIDSSSDNDSESSSNSSNYDAEKVIIAGGSEGDDSDTASNYDGSYAGGQWDGDRGERPTGDDDEEDGAEDDGEHSSTPSSSSNSSSTSLNSSSVFSLGQLPDAYDAESPLVMTPTDLSEIDAWDGGGCNPLVGSPAHSARSSRKKRNVGQMQKPVEIVRSMSMSSSSATTTPLADAASRNLVLALPGVGNGRRDFGGRSDGGGENTRANIPEEIAERGGWEGRPSEKQRSSAFKQQKQPDESQQQIDAGLSTEPAKFVLSDSSENESVIFVPGSYTGPSSQHTLLHSPFPPPPPSISTHSTVPHLNRLHSTQPQSPVHTKPSPKQPYVRRYGLNAPRSSSSGTPSSPSNANKRARGISINTSELPHSQDQKDDWHSNGNRSRGSASSTPVHLLTYSSSSSGTMWSNTLSQSPGSFTELPHPPQGSFRNRRPPALSTISGRNIRAGTRKKEKNRVHPIRTAPIHFRRHSVDNNPLPPYSGAPKPNPANRLRCVSEDQGSKHTRDGSYMSNLSFVSSASSSGSGASEGTWIDANINNQAMSGLRKESAPPPTAPPANFRVTSSSDGGSGLGGILSRAESPPLNPRNRAGTSPEMYNSPPRTNLHVASGKEGRTSPPLHPKSRVTQKRATTGLSAILNKEVHNFFLRESSGPAAGGGKTTAASSPPQPSHCRNDSSGSGVSHHRRISSGSFGFGSFSNPIANIFSLVSSLSPSSTSSPTERLGRSIEDEIVEYRQRARAFLSSNEALRARQGSPVRIDRGGTLATAGSIVSNNTSNTKSNLLVTASRPRRATSPRPPSTRGNHRKGLASIDNDDWTNDGKEEEEDDGVETEEQKNATAAAMNRARRAFTNKKTSYGAIKSSPPPKRLSPPGTSSYKKVWPEKIGQKKQTGKDKRRRSRREEEEPLLVSGERSRRNKIDCSSESESSSSNPKRGRNVIKSSGRKSSNSHRRYTTSRKGSPQTPPGISTAEGGLKEEDIDTNNYFQPRERERSSASRPLQPPSGCRATPPSVGSIGGGSRRSSRHEHSTTPNDSEKERMYYSREQKKLVERKERRPSVDDGSSRRRRKKGHHADDDSSRRRRKERYVDDENRSRRRAKEERHMDDYDDSSRRRRKDGHYLDEDSSRRRKKLEFEKLKIEWREMAEMEREEKKRSKKKKWGKKHRRGRRSSKPEDSIWSTSSSSSNSANPLDALRRTEKFERKKAKLLAKWTEEMKEEEARRRREMPTLCDIISSYFQYYIAKWNIKKSKDTFEAMISNLPFTICAIAMAVVTLGVVWFKFTETINPACKPTYFRLNTCTFPEFPGCFECDFSDWRVATALYFHYVCSAFAGLLVLLFVMKIIVAPHVVLDELTNPTTSSPAGLLCMTVVCVFAGRGWVGQGLVFLMSSLHLLLAIGFIYTALAYKILPEPSWFPNTVGIGICAVKTWLYFPFVSFAHFLMGVSVICYLMFFPISLIRVTSNEKISAPVCWIQMSAPAVSLYSLTIMAQPSTVDGHEMNPTAFQMFHSSVYLPSMHAFFFMAVVGVISSMQSFYTRWKRFKYQEFSPAHAAFCFPVLAHANAVQSYYGAVTAFGGSKFPPGCLYLTIIWFYWFVMLLFGTILTFTLTTMFFYHLSSWVIVDVEDEDEPPQPSETMMREIIGTGGYAMNVEFMSTAVLQANEAGALVRVAGRADGRNPFIRTRRVRALGFDPTLNWSELEQERDKLLDWVVKNPPRRRVRTMSVPGVDFSYSFGSGQQGQVWDGGNRVRAATSDMGERGGMVGSL